MAIEHPAGEPLEGLRQPDVVENGRAELDGQGAGQPDGLDEGLLDAT